MKKMSSPTTTTEALLVIFRLAFVASLMSSQVNGQFYQALNPNSFDLNYNPNSSPSGVSGGGSGGYGYDESSSSNTNNNFNPNTNPIDDGGYIEKKFVNSGQSIVLICDLPNNMPDGKVSVLFLVF